VHKVLKTLASSVYALQPKQTHYGTLEIDEFWTYAGKQKTKKRLIYAYCRASGEITAYVRGKRDLKTARKLRERLRRLGITCDAIAGDDGDSFATVFQQDK
jgi:IS1 family transposase